MQINPIIVIIAIVITMVVIMKQSYQIFNQKKKEQDLSLIKDLQMQ